VTFSQSLGKFEKEEFFDLADEYGILIMIGWACCDSWQHWSAWTNDTHVIAMQSLRTQV
jgi:exo-1,4-beta-D-glucosaminidase